MAMRSSRAFTLLPSVSKYRQRRAAVLREDRRSVRGGHRGVAFRLLLGAQARDLLLRANQVSVRDGPGRSLGDSALRKLGARGERRDRVGVEADQGERCKRVVQAGSLLDAERLEL